MYSIWGHLFDDKFSLYSGLLLKQYNGQANENDYIQLVVIGNITVIPMFIHSQIESLSSFPNVDRSAKSTFNTIHNMGHSTICNPLDYDYCNCWWSSHFGNWCHIYKYLTSLTYL